MHFDSNDVCYSFLGLRGKAHFETAPDLYSERFVCSYLVGAFTSRKRNLIDDGRTPVAERITAREAREAIGEWMGVFRDESGVCLIMGDQFGYQPIYYREFVSDLNTSLLVGSSPGAIAKELSRIGGETSLNSMEFSASINTQHAWAVTQQSDETFEAETKILFPGQALLVSNSGWKVVESTIFDASDLTYEQCLERGLSRAVDHVNIAMDYSAEQKHLNLSGGRDSRLVLGLLAASGRVGEVSITTMNPDTWIPKSARPLLYKDLYIANTLRKKYGLKWTRPLPVDYYPLDFDESLDYWQAYRSHKNFRFKAQNHVYLQRGTNIEFRGAAGETFRGFNAVSNLLSSTPTVGAEDSLHQDTRAIVESIYAEGNLTDDLKDLYADRLYCMFKRLGAKSIEQALHYRYSVFRNRSHFGHVRASLALNQFPVLPLSQPEFVWAYDKLSPEERNSERLVADIIRMSEPELGKVPFDDGSVFKNPSFDKGDRKVVRISEDREILGDFFELDATAVADRRVMRANANKRDRHSFDKRFATINRLKELLTELADFDNDGYLSKTERVRLFQQIEGQRLNPLPLLAKAASAKDAISGNGGEHVVRFDYREKKPNVFSLEETVRKSRYSVDGERALRFQLPAEAVDGKIRGTVRVWGGVSGPLKYRFRLMSEQGPVGSTNFSDSNSCEFDCPSEKGKYRIQAFVTTHRNQDVPFKFYSRYLTV